MSRPAATERLVRMLAYLPWIVAQDGPEIDVVCRRFGVSREELLSDLAVLFMSGLPPYTPDVLFEYIVEDDRVWVHLGDVFEQPLRLTPAEGLALVAAGGALRGLEGYDPAGSLERGLLKLARVLGVDPDLVDSGASDPGLLDRLTRAAGAHRSVDIDYYSHGRDEHTHRRVDPWRVFHDKGAWYLVGHCHLAEGERVFRVDRIAGLEVTDTTFEPPESAAPTGAFQPTDDDPRVTLELDPEARWVVEQYPNEKVTDSGDGRLRVRLAVAARPWFERLLLRCGTAARVIESDDPELLEAGGLAASRVLARYRAGSLGSL